MAPIHELTVAMGQECSHSWVPCSFSQGCNLAACWVVISSEAWDHPPGSYGCGQNSFPCSCRIFFFKASSRDHLWTLLDVLLKGSLINSGQPKLVFFWLLNVTWWGTLITFTKSLRFWHILRVLPTLKERGSHKSMATGGRNHGGQLRNLPRTGGEKFFTW